MEISKKAFETTGTVDSQNQLVLDEPLPVFGTVRVRVVILLPEEVDIEETEWLKTASVNPAFDNLKDPQEDVYSLTDGRPFHDVQIKMRQC